MAYVLSAAGSSNPVLTLVALAADGTTPVTGDLAIPYLQDVTINNAQDIFTWQQLDTSGKLSVPTTSTNSINATVVVDPTTFFGTGPDKDAYDPADDQGLVNLSKNKQKVNFTINIGDTSGTGRTISGSGYVTGLAPTVSADSPVWTTPVTITVDGDFTIA